MCVFDLPTTISINQSYPYKSSILAKDHSPDFLRHSSSIIAPTYKRHVLRFVSENWPVTEINRFLFFIAQGGFRANFSRSGILGSPSWPSGNGLFLGLLIRLPPLNSLFLQSLVYELQDHAVHRPKLALGDCIKDLFHTGWHPDIYCYLHAHIINKTIPICNLFLDFLA